MSADDDENAQDEPAADAPRADEDLPGEAGTGEAGPGEAGPDEDTPHQAGPVEAGPAEAGPEDGEDADAGPLPRPAEVGRAAEPLVTPAELEQLLGGAFAGRTAMERILEAGLVLYERLPMLDVVLDRFTRFASVSLRGLLGVNVELFVDQVATVRFGNHVDGIPQPSMFGVFRAEEWENQGLALVEAGLVYALVDISLGGRSGLPRAIEGRSFTLIERGIVEKILARLLADLGTSFLPLCGVNFVYERTETNSRAASISSASSAAINVRLRMEAAESIGVIQLVLPYATLEPVREALIQQYMGEKFGRDSIWENHLREELRETEIELRAVLDEKSMKLSDFMALQVGDQLSLDVAINEGVTLICGGTPVFKGRIGRKGGRVAVRLEGRAGIAA